MLWSEVILITVTLSSEVSQLWICVNFNVFRTALPELLPTPPSIHTSLQLEKHYIGCQLSTVLSLRLPCLYISSYTVVTPNYIEQCLYVMRLRICLLTVIKRYKSAIRIRISHLTFIKIVNLSFGLIKRTNNKTNFIFTICKMTITILSSYIIALVMQGLHSFIFNTYYDVSHEGFLKPQMCVLANVA